MNWKKRCLNEFRLYAVTDLKTADSTAVKQIERALEGGVDIIQLRSKHLCDADLMSLGKRILKVTRRKKKLFIINDRVDLMMALDADGVHLGQDDMSVKDARKLIGRRDKLIGKSTHSLDQAKKAFREPVDYIGFGPVFSTPTKPTYKPIGMNDIGNVIRRAPVPVVCIGGINKSNASKIIKAGANRIAVVRAVFSANSPRLAANELKGMLEE